VSAFVLDTSIALKWFLEDENDRAYSLTILSSLSDEYRPIVPPAKPTILQLPYLAREHRLISYDAAFPRISAPPSTATGHQRQGLDPGGF